MSIISKDYRTNLICGMSLNEAVDTASSAILEKELSNILQIDMIKENELSLTPETVRVLKKNGNYFIEYSEVRRLAENNEVSDLDALESVAEYYSDQANITADNFYVVIESDQFFNKALEEAKTGDKKSKLALQESINTIKELQSKGVKFAKKV